MDHPEVIAPDGLAFEGSADQVDDLVVAFRGLPRRRLVVIGGPGTGKTTLAVQLLVHLLATRHDREPVPVLFSLIDFDPERLSLAGWLAARLVRDYPGLDVPAARALVERDRLLPVLDGLDEVPADRRTGILRALNTTAGGTSGFILTSRRAAFASSLAESQDVLTAAAVISPLALTGGESCDYLRTQLAPDARRLAPIRSDGWARVLAVLESGSAHDLALVASTPLGLWLIRVVYLDGRRDPLSLIDPQHPDRNERALGSHLLDQLIPATVEHVGAVGRPDARVARLPKDSVAQFCRYLTTVAEQLRMGDTRDWLWWHLPQYTLRSNSARLGARVVLASATTLVLGLPLLVISILFDATAILDLFDSTAAFFLVGGVAGLLLFRMARRPRNANLQLRGRLLALLGRLFLGLLAGIIIAFAAAFVYYTTAARVPLYLEDGFILLVMLAPAVGPCVVILDFLSSDSLALRAISPTASHRGDCVRLGVQILAVAAILLTLFLVLIPAVFPVDSEMSTYLVIAFLALLATLVVGLAVGQAQTAFVISLVFLVARRRLPLRLMRFLDNAHQLGLLRVIGPAYQFRHAELQDHLAPPADRA